ncbi:MAG: ATP-binding protein [Candidatus Latescibacterota bacterium]|jgi:signal transduction histidine kinase
MAGLVRAGVLAGVLLGALVRPATAGPEKVALAYPVSGIVVDGDLSDWPDDLSRYPIATVEGYDPPDHPGDFVGTFRVGYDERENALYVAVEMTDDSPLPGRLGESDWTGQDGCELYLWGVRGHRDPPTQYWIRGPNQGHNSPGSKTELQGAVRQTSDGYRYEWRIDVGRTGNRVSLVPGVVLGFDLALIDLDQDRSFSWISWSRGTGKWGDANRLGRLILVEQGISVDRAMELLGQTLEAPVAPAGEWPSTSVGYRMFLSGILVAFTLLHFLLFLFDTKNRANLFYALYTGLIGLAVFTGFQLETARYLSPERIEMVKSLAVSGVGAVGLGFLFSLFRVEPPRRIRYLVGGLVVTAGLVALDITAAGSWVSATTESVAKPLLSILGIGVFVETLLALLKAVRRRRESAWTIGISFSIFALSVQPLIRQSEIGTSDLYWVLIPLVAMSVYLARSVARTNRALQAQLAHVEQLSHKTQEQYEQIQEQNRQIQEASRLKSDFLARMSHDLRTPMNAIIGYTRILLRKTRDQLDERQFRNLENIQISADNLLALINDILDLSKIESGRMEVKVDQVELVPLVAECCSSVESLVRPGVELRRELAEVGPIRTDPDRLRRALMNVLSNAVKFTEQGQVTVSLRRAGEWAEISIADTGIGIPAADLPFIFDEFRQAGRQKGTPREGTGLGLAIARRSLGLLGGTIHAESAEGKGSVFTVRLKDCPETPVVAPASR